MVLDGAAVAHKPAAHGFNVRRLLPLLVVKVQFDLIFFGVLDGDSFVVPTNEGDKCDTDQHCDDDEPDHLRFGPQDDEDQDSSENNSRQALAPEAASDARLGEAFHSTILLRR